jgi:crotonobetainyl-CoA:carnitine CoA-transferase CaiB-like acyl-CoA transferase
VALDLRRPEGRDLVLRWVERFDVLIENFRPGTLERWGLAPPTCARPTRGWWCCG